MTLNPLSMRLRSLTLAVAALALAGCGEQDEPGTGPRPGATGRIRFVNALSNATAASRPLNVTVDGVVLAANLGYAASAPSGAAAPYFPALAGEHQLLVQRTADTTAHLLERTFPVTAGQDLTLVALEAQDGTVSLITRGDDANAAPTSGVKIRVTHAARSAGGTLDVYVTPSTVTNIANIPPQVQGMSFTSSTDYLAADAGSYTIRFTLGGTKTVLATATTGALANGAVRSVFVLDAAAGGTPLTTLVLIDR
jgi:hypothetical protein